MPQPEPSQLVKLRTNLVDQAAAARMSMLSQCELDTIDPPPILPSKKAPAATTAKGGGPPAAKKAAVDVSDAAGAPAPSVLRATTKSAALAQRLSAREARRKREEQEARATQRKKLAEAVMEERKAEMRAMLLREEVIRLEQEELSKQKELEHLEEKKALETEAKKVVESERYFEALRSKLRDEAKHRARPLPPLCACGLDPLDNHTEKCCRNCIFFKNPAAYGRALSGLFVRPIVLD